MTPDRQLTTKRLYSRSTTDSDSLPTLRCRLSKNRQWRQSHRCRPVAVDAPIAADRQRCALPVRWHRRRTAAYRERVFGLSARRDRSSLWISIVSRNEFEIRQNLPLALDSNCTPTGCPFVRNYRIENCASFDRPAAMCPLM